MIYITITSDGRGEGKTTLAVKLLNADPEAYLQVDNPELRRWVINKFHIAPSIAARIIVGRTEQLRGVVSYVIRDITPPKMRIRKGMEDDDE